MRDILISIYCMPLYCIVVIMLLTAFIWRALPAIIEKKISKKAMWNIGNIVAAGTMLLIILIVTVFSRKEGTGLILIPFHSFIEAKTQPEIYRSMLMNVFLFFPLGLTLPYALQGKWKHQVLFTILFAFIFSVAIEYLQYHFSLGRAEVDDVLCNTLGCAIGTLSFRKDDKTVNETL